MTQPLFEKVAFIGLGLIGSSLARVIQAEQLAHEVVASTRSQKTLEDAKALGLIAAGGASRHRKLHGFFRESKCVVVDVRSTIVGDVFVIDARWVGWKLLYRKAAQPQAAVETHFHESSLGRSKQQTSERGRKRLDIIPG